MLGTIPGSVLPFLSMCPKYIYLYLLEGANVSNSIKTNFHFTAKPVLCTFWASILGLSEMANGDVPVQVAADGEKNSQLMSTHNSKLKFIRKLLQMFLLFWELGCFVQLETCRSRVTLLQLAALLLLDSQVSMTAPWPRFLVFFLVVSTLLPWWVFSRPPGGKRPWGFVRGIGRRVGRSRRWCRLGNRGANQCAQQF